MVWVSAGAPQGMPRADLKQRRVVDQALFDHLIRKTQVAQIEDLELRLHAQLLNAFCHFAQDDRRADIEVVAVAKIERAAIETTDLGKKLLDMP